MNPPHDCPGCVADVGQTFPAGATSRHCARCLDRIRRVHQCARWNRDHAHQAAAGHVSWDAFSARWRASGGLPPLSADAARRYVTPQMVRGPLGTVLPEALCHTIYRAWCTGLLIGVEAWLSDDPPPDPAGLWASSPVGALPEPARERPEWRASGQLSERTNGDGLRRAETKR